MHSLHYAYVSRRTIKRDYRKLWIVRINAACRNYDMNYSTLMHGLKLANVNVNRKMLSSCAYGKISVKNHLQYLICRNKILFSIANMLMRK